MKTYDISEYIVPGRRAHLVGIGGVSMRPLGLVLKGMGLEVSGSDMSASLSTEELEEKGIHVAIGHRAENILGADCVIRPGDCRCPQRRHPGVRAGPGLGRDHEIL